MRGSFGLVIGVALGAGGMYLALRGPWAHAPAVVPTGDRPPVVMVSTDAGVGKAKPKRRRANHPHEAPGPNEPEADDGGGAAPIALTAGDRALEVRGDDVSLPARTIDVGAGADARPLDDGEIRSTLAAQAGAVKDCVVRGATGTDLQATITIEMVVDGGGRVTRSRVSAPRYLHEHGLVGCVQRALARVRFPGTGGATRVTLPVTLG